MIRLVVLTLVLARDAIDVLESCFLAALPQLVHRSIQCYPQVEQTLVHVGGQEVCLFSQTQLGLVLLELVDQRLAVML